MEKWVCNGCMLNFSNTLSCKGGIYNILLMIMKPLNSMSMRILIGRYNKSMNVEEKVLRNEMVEYIEVY